MIVGESGNTAIIDAPTEAQRAADCMVGKPWLATAPRGFHASDPEVDDRSFRRTEGHAMYDSKRLDLLGRDLKTMSVAAALTLWVPTSGIVAGWWRRFARDFAKPYRPELHYMRGPGPKWREKHGLGSR
jgi:hypothetical protein